MTVDEMVTLIRAVSDNGLTGFEYAEGEQRLILRKENAQPHPAAAERPAEAGTEAAPAAEHTQAEGKKADLIGSDKVIVSPLVGTFYASANPDAEPFVKVGDTVKKGQVLGIVEAMKLMNEIESEYDGVVEAVLAENEGIVEYGQPLFRIR